jgi:hypothetical protein
MRQRGTRLHEQDYYVTLDLGDGPSARTGWTCRLTYSGWGKVATPTKRKLQSDARRQAVAAFGRQARAWKLLSYRKATKHERVR